MLRQRPGKEEPVSPLDSDEQELLVAAIAKEAKHQVTLFRRVFQALMVVYAVAVAFCWLHLIFRGDEDPLPHRAVFDRVPDIAFHATYLGHLDAIYLAYKIAEGNKWHILALIMVAWTSLFSWLAVFRHFWIIEPLFYWMPLAPTFLFGVSTYIYTLQKGLEQDVDELKKLRYNHKEL